MRKQYVEFDEQLLKNEFLKRHYECLPFIGEKYKDSRLLLIGESHYVPDDDVHCVNREDFYSVSFDDLADGEYKNWIDTRCVFEYRVYDHKDLKGFFYNSATEIAKVIYHTNKVCREQVIEAMHRYAFMNYFKRPSYNQGKTIEGLTIDDYRYAYEVSNCIIDILKPKLVIFLSKKAYYAFLDSTKDRGDGLKCKVESVSHPSSAWWNRRRKDGRCAREDFRDYVSEIL